MYIYKILDFITTIYFRYVSNSGYLICDHNSCVIRTDIGCFCPCFGFGAA